MKIERKERKENGRKRIMLVTPMLHQGGFERICVLTAKLLKDRYDVYLAVFSTQDIFYDVEGLQLIDLRLGAARGSLGKLANICRRVRRLRQLKKELCIDISYSFGTTANIANVLSKGRDVTWAGIRGYSALSDRGARLIFRRADCVISCTRTMEAEINRVFGTKKSETLYNPCDLAQIAALLDTGRSGMEKEPESGPLIVSMGREDDLKGFWHLIRSFAVVKGAVADARLMIIGEGSYAEYRKLAGDLGIADAVCFTGALRNPFPLLARADVYALTSQSEGFPNALIEAMACGTPCVSVNCKTGPAEILTEDYERYSDLSAVCEAEYGILTPVFEGEKSLEPSITAQERQYAQVIVDLLRDDAKRREYSKRAVERAGDFGVDRYVDQITGMVESAG